MYIVNSNIVIRQKEVIFLNGVIGLEELEIQSDLKLRKLFELETSKV
jgi:hypothetical protein